MLHFSKIPQIASRKDGKNKPIPFSFQYVKVNTGEIIRVDRAVMTSSFHQGTMNVRILSSGQIRKVIIPLIIEFNNSPVYM